MGIALSMNDFHVNHHFVQNIDHDFKNYFRWKKIIQIQRL